MLSLEAATDDAASAGWNAAVFTSRETPAAVMEAVSAVLGGARHNTIVDVLVNGNPRLADAISALCVREPGCAAQARLRVWHIAMGDKAHAWNTYVHRIWPGGDITYFIDGYVRVDTHAFARLERVMHANPEALGGTGVPSIGRSASALRNEMAREGGLHGNLFAIKRGTMKTLRNKGFHLPLGIYRTDSTIGAALAFGLDPSSQQWDPKQRIAQAPDVTWQTRPQRWWNLGDVRTHLRRLDRQAQGRLENRAVSDWLAQRKLPPHTLPRTALELVAQWAKREPLAFETALAGSRRIRRAWQALQSPRDWSQAELPPVLTFDSLAGR